MGEMDFVFVFGLKECHVKNAIWSVNLASFGGILFIGKENKRKSSIERFNSGNKHSLRQKNHHNRFRS